jgi:hypothetical protein
MTSGTTPGNVDALCVRRPVGGIAFKDTNGRLAQFVAGCFAGAMNQSNNEYFISMRGVAKLETTI